MARSASKIGTVEFAIAALRAVAFYLERERAGRGSLLTADMVYTTFPTETRLSVSDRDC